MLFYLYMPAWVEEVNSSLLGTSGATTLCLQNEGMVQMVENHI